MLKGLLGVLLFVCATNTAFAGGKLIFEPSKEIGKDNEATAKWGLSIFQNVLGPMSIVSFTGVGHGLKSGEMEYAVQKLGASFQLGNNLQLEGGGIMSRELDTVDKYTEKRVYGKISVQLW